MQRMVVWAILALGSATAVAETSVSLLERLASPEFEGRGVGTAGLARARDALVAELEGAGFLPGFEKGFTRGFQVFTGSELGPENGFAGSSPVDFIPLAFSRSGALTAAEALFVGYGISFRGKGAGGEELVYDDYEGVDARGRIVIAVQGDPSIGNAGSVFRDPAHFHYSSLMYKVRNAELHGAAGIVLVRDALSLRGEDEPALVFQPRQGGGATLSILAGQARIEFAERVLGRSVRELQAAIASGQRPLSFRVAGLQDLSVELRRQVGEVHNVTALVPGNDPALANEYVVLGSHYDHLGYGGDSSMDPAGSGRIHFGADDNASGVQAVMDLARRIRAQGTNRRPVLVAFFTAEEIGLLGSKHWTEQLPLPPGAKLAWMFNLDMVGRMQEYRLSVLSASSAREFKPLLLELNRSFGFDLRTADQGFGGSDHSSFLQLQVPALFFTTGAHPDYHRPSDTAEKINWSGLMRIEDFVFATWQALDARPLAPVFDPSGQDQQPPPGQGRGYGAYFGSIPEFEQGTESGVRLSGVRAGSPAEQVGLAKGDLLTGLGEIEIRNLGDLVFALRFYRPGDEIEVRWSRFGARLRARVELRSRDS